MPLERILAAVLLTVISLFALAAERVVYPSGALGQETRPVDDTVRAGAERGSSTRATIEPSPERAGRSSDTSGGIVGDGCNAASVCC